jgi:hypothetical protein
MKKVKSDALESLCDLFIELYEKNALKKMRYLCQSSPVNSPDIIY